jgi:aryl-alcohol dehydrogenase-like predicted oxidoreductase
LKRLQMDYVDLLFCHRPDLKTSVEETIRAMNIIIQQGKAFYWGTSEWPAAQIMEAYGVAQREHLIPPAMEQPQYNMFHRERVEKEYAPLYKKIGLGTTVWSPLASGLLTGKYNDGIPEGTRVTLPNYGWLPRDFESETTEQKIEKVNRLAPLANSLGCTLAQMSLAWCLKNTNVSTVITSASKPQQIIENMKAIEVLPLVNDAIMARIEEVLDNKPELETGWG